MLAATWVKMSDSRKKENKNKDDISSIKRVTRKLLEVSRCSRAKQRQRMYKKSVPHVQSCLFANQTYFCFFTVLVAFSAQHYTILHFVRANYKYYRELRFQPWLNLFINDSFIYPQQQPKTKFSQRSGQCLPIPNPGFNKPLGYSASLTSLTLLYTVITFIRNESLFKENFLFLQDQQEKGTSQHLDKQSCV